RKTNISHCIRAHRFRGKCRPETPEAKVLFDADKLDAIGAVGVARAFLFAGEVGARLHNPDMKIEETMPYSREDTGFREFKVKLCKIRERILTEEGKKLADERHAFMEGFFNRFLEEYEGKR
ncbi:MAG: phosphohydrolase, partial [Desulfobacterales bacterium]|nr:phosphohydrolase [Desulfobacterales bacterium]